MKNSAKFGSLFVNIQCAIVCSFEKVNFKVYTAVSVEPQVISIKFAGYVS